MPRVRLRLALLTAAASGAAMFFVVACSSAPDDSYVPPSIPPRADASVIAPIKIADCRVDRDEALPCEKTTWSASPPWIGTDTDGGALDGAASDAKAEGDAARDCVAVRHMAIDCAGDAGDAATTMTEVHHGITIAAGRDGRGWALAQDERGRRLFEYTREGIDEGRGFRDEGAAAALTSDGERPSVVTSIAFPRRGVVYGAAEAEPASFDADPEVDDLAAGAWHTDDGALLGEFHDNNRTKGNRIFTRSPDGAVRVDTYGRGSLVIGPSHAFVVTTLDTMFEADRFDWAPLGGAARTIAVTGGQAGRHFTLLPEREDLPPAFLRQFVYGSANARLFFVYVPLDASRYAMIKIPGEPPPSGPCRFDVANDCAGSCTEEVEAIEEDSMRLARGDGHLYLGYLVERRFYETTATVDQPSQLECALLGLCKKYCAPRRAIREKRGEKFALAAVDLASHAVRELLRVDAGVDANARNDDRAVQLFVRDGVAHVGLRTSEAGRRTRLSTLVIPFGHR